MGGDGSGRGAALPGALAPTVLRAWSPEVPHTCFPPPPHTKGRPRPTRCHTEPILLAETGPQGARGSKSERLTFFSRPAFEFVSGVKMLCLWGSWAAQAWHVVPVTVVAFVPRYPFPFPNMQSVGKREGWSRLRHGPRRQGAKAVT